MKGFTRKITWHLLFQSQKDRSVKAFTGITLAGIALAVMLFFLVDVVLSGFSTRIREILIGFDAPISIEAPYAENSSLEDKLKGYDFASVQEFHGLLSTEGDVRFGAKARFVDGDFFQLPHKSNLQILLAPDFDFESFLNSNDQILIGEELYKSLPILDSDDERVKLILPFADLGPSGEIEPQEKEFFVAGIFATGYYDIDHLYVLLPKKSLFGFGNPDLLFNQILIDHDDVQFSTSQAFLQGLGDQVGEGVDVRTWFQKNKALFQAMSLEKAVFHMIFILIVLISGINLLSLVRMFTLSQKQELMTLKALGLSHRQLLKVFSLLGCALGSMGLIIGLVLSALIIVLIKTLGLHLPEAYGFEEIPVQIRALTVFGLIVLTPILAALISLGPVQKWKSLKVSEELLKQ